MIDSEFKKLENKLLQKNTKLDRLNLLYEWCKTDTVKARQFRRLVAYCF